MIRDGKSRINKGFLEEKLEKNRSDALSYLERLCIKAGGENYFDWTACLVGVALPMGLPGIEKMSEQR